MIVLTRVALYRSLIKQQDYNQNATKGFKDWIGNPNSCVFGLDLESFASKNNVMDSGVNTRFANLSIDMNFDPFDALERNLREWGQSCTIRFYCMYDMFLSINDIDGTITNEY